MLVALEITDIFGAEEETGRYEYFPKKIHFGAEVDLTYAAFRVGLNQGYPTFGIGLMAGIVDLDYVYFTEESGYFTGQRPKPKHVVSLGLAFNVAGKKTAGEAGAKLINRTVLPSSSNIRNPADTVSLPSDPARITPAAK
jgi:hypothetical protein